MASAPERLDDLLVQRATEGLAEAERHELDELIARLPGIDARGFERAAAAVQLAALPRIDALPPSLAQRVARDAEQYFTASRMQADKPSAAAAMPVSAFRPRQSDRSINPSWAWLAAAAALVLAIAGWWPGTDLSRPTPELQMAELIEQGALHLEWMATADPAAAGAAGDLVWSPASQSGFMRFRGLAANEADRFQYQLWIFDADRDERYPVDGGVFDIPPGSDEVIVPIDARLSVGNAVLFAVTVEAPGGVVVSSRDRIALVAEVG